MPTIDSINYNGTWYDMADLTPELKTALLACFEDVAWKNGDSDGRAKINALYDALYYRYWQVTNTLSGCITSNTSAQTVKGAAYSATLSASAGHTMEGATVSITMGGINITSTAYSNGVISIPSVTGALVITVTAVELDVTSISAVFTQGENTIYSITPFSYITPYLVVTATYEDSSTAEVSSDNYTLSGTLTAGTSAVTVSYGGKTTTFNVTVTGATALSGTIIKNCSVGKSGANPVMYYYTDTNAQENNLSWGGSSGSQALPRGNGSTTKTVYPVAVASGATKIIIYAPDDGDIVPVVRMYTCKLSETNWIPTSAFSDVYYETPYELDISSVNDGGLYVVLTATDKAWSKTINSADTSTWVVGYA